MKIAIRNLGFVLFFAAAVPITGAHAADRLRAGQWEMTVDAKGKTFSHKNCTTRAEVDMMNSGDAKAIQAYANKQLDGSGCSVKDVKISGTQVTQTTQCAGAAITSVTTYRGDSYESESSNGTKIHAKRIGACP